MKKDTTGSYYDVLFNSVTDVIYTLDAKGKITSLSPSFQKVTGWERNDWIGRSFDEILHAEDASRAMKDFCDLLAGDAASYQEYRIITQNGNYLLGEFKSNPIIKNGTIVGFIGLARDLSRLQIETSKNLLLASIIESADSAIYSRNLEGRIISWNPGAEALFHFAKAEIMGNHISIIIPKRKRKEETLILEHIKQGETIGSFETFGVTREGHEIPILVKVSPVFGTENEVIGASYITKDFSREIKLRKEKRQEEKRKNEFINMASHELKTPLTSLAMYTHLLKLKHEPSKDGCSLIVDKIEKQTAKLTKLVSDLLDITNIQSGTLQYKMEAFPLDEVIHDVANTLQEMTTKHKIAVKNGETIPIYADKNRIQQVLMNLLVNAIKYSPHGGTILVNANTEGHFAKVSVADHGIGIAREHQEKIFDKLYQAAGTQEKTYPGLGIGLYIASDIIKKHGGSIGVSSRIGKGATFTFTLPLLPYTNETQNFNH